MSEIPSVERLSSADMDRIGRVGLTPLDWARERLANSERIAATKTGDDRESWHEDEAYWRAIVIALTALRTSPSVGERSKEVDQDGAAAPARTDRSLSPSTTEPLPDWPKYYASDILQDGTIRRGREIMRAEFDANYGREPLWRMPNSCSVEYIGCVVEFSRVSPAAQEQAETPERAR